MFFEEVEASLAFQVAQLVSLAWNSEDLRLRKTYPLVMTNIAIENGPPIVDLPIENGDL